MLLEEAIAAELEALELTMDDKAELETVLDKWVEVEEACDVELET